MFNLKTLLQRRKDRRELLAMDDAQLFDLGISRDQIDAYLRGAVQTAAKTARQPAEIIAFPAERICCHRTQSAA